MKRAMVLLVLVSVVLSVPSSAAPTIQMLNDPTPGYSMKILEDGFAGYEAGSILTTFCLEKDENFYPGTSYYAVVNTEALSRDWFKIEADPLDERTAYLYTQYMQGNSDFQDQGKLQQAIWYIEQESRYSNSYVGLANQAIAGGEWSGLGNVRVANLYKYFDGSKYCGFAQDQLIMISTVPAPGALVLGGIGTLMVRWLRRRKALV